MTSEELKKVEEKTGFPLPDYYKSTMLAYPFTEDEFTTPYFLPNAPKTLVKLNSKPAPIEGINRIFFIGAYPDIESYFVDASPAASPVYALDFKTKKHSVKAGTWSEYLELIQQEMKEVQEEIAFDREREMNNRRQQGVWTRDYSPLIWRWLGPVVGVFFVYCGIKTIVTMQFRYHSQTYHGVTAVIGGIMLLLLAYFMFRGPFWKRKWSAVDVSIGICAGAIFLGFLVLRWIDIL